MTTNHVNTSLMGKHKINKANVEIYFAPEVIEAFVSNDEISVINNLKAGEEYDLYPLETHFKNIFEIVINFPLSSIPSKETKICEISSL